MITAWSIVAPNPSAARPGSISISSVAVSQPDIKKADPQAISMPCGSMADARLSEHEPASHAI